MLIGFLGDLHGHVFEALALVLTWQRLNHRALDLIVQLGDFVGPTHASPWRGRPFVEEPPLTRAELEELERADPGQFDLDRLLAADGSLAQTLEDARSRLARPILFMRGNHEDTSWCRSLSGCIDPFDLFHYVPDGHVVEVDEARIACLGGAYDDESVAGCIDGSAAAALAAGTADALATHDGPYGIGRGYHGNVQGSRTVSSLVESMRPRWHVSAHLHHVIGPKRIGPTNYVGLDEITASKWDPKPGLMPGSFAILDTDIDTITLVDEPWLSSIGGYGTRFDLVEFLED